MIIWSPRKQFPGNMHVLSAIFLCQTFLFHFVLAGSGRSCFPKNNMEPTSLSPRKRLSLSFGDLLYGYHTALRLPGQSRCRKSITSSKRGRWRMKGEIYFLAHTPSVPSLLWGTTVEGNGTVRADGFSWLLEDWRMCNKAAIVKRDEFPRANLLF